MAEITRIERLRAAIATEGHTVAYYTREVISGMPIVDIDAMPGQAERARLRKKEREAEFAARRLLLIGGDETFGGGTVRDPHPSKRKGTGMDRLHKQFYIEADGILPELPPSGDPGGVLNKYSGSRFFLEGDAAVILLNPDLSREAKEEALFPILIKLDTLRTKEEELRLSLRDRAVRKAF